VSDEPHLTPEDERKAEEKESVSADITYEAIRRQGDHELERSTSGLAWSGLAAGLSMGFSFVGEGVLYALLPDAPWRPLVSKLGYAIGFLIVILGSQQLFTENTLTPIVPYLSRRSEVSAGNVLRLWGVVLVANLVGTILFAYVIARTTLFDPEIHRGLAAVGAEALKPDVWSIFVRGIFAGWLIALMVWMLPAASEAQVLVIIVMTWLIGVGHFSHVIAGSAVVAYMVATGASGWGDYGGHFLLPTLIGNVLGGVTLVAALNHAQVAGGKK
jgi:formate/nitrite transporter FocA (FNT family)